MWRSVCTVQRARSPSGRLSGAASAMSVPEVQPRARRSDPCLCGIRGRSNAGAKRPGDLRLRPPLDAEHGRCQPPPRPAARHRSADREPARPDRRSGPVAADPMSVWTPMAGNPDRAGTRRRGLVRHASGERRGKRERQKHNPQICHLRSSVGTVVRGCTTRAQRPLPHDRSPGTKGASAMSAVRDGKTVPGV